MSDPGDLRRKLLNHIHATVAFALIAVALFEAGLAGVLAEFADGRFKAGMSEYLEFGQLYAGTFLLSATITLAFASWELPPLVGWAQNWWYPLLILVGGACLTLRSTQPQVLGGTTPFPTGGVGGPTFQPEGPGPLGWAAGAMRVFFDHYGAAAVGGIIVGVAGGVIIYMVAEYLIKGTVGD